MVDTPTPRMDSREGPGFEERAWRTYWRAPKLTAREIALMGATAVTAALTAAAIVASALM